MNRPDVTVFIQGLDAIPWFLSLGKPHPRDNEVVRIHSWEEWPGPETRLGYWFAQWQSVVEERIQAEESGRRTELEALWDRVHQVVFQRAAANVPLYDPEEDAWHGPTACVWHAAYTACLLSWHLLLRRRIPERLADEWNWYTDGHWPCGFAEEPPDFEDEAPVDFPTVKLLVY